MISITIVATSNMDVLLCKRCYQLVPWMSPRHGELLALLGHSAHLPKTLSLNEVQSVQSETSEEVTKTQQSKLARSSSLIETTQQVDT